MIAPVSEKVKTPLVVVEVNSYSSVTGSLAVAVTFPVYVVSSSIEIELLDARVIANGTGGALPPPPPPPQEAIKLNTINNLNIFTNKLYLNAKKRGLKSPLLIN